MKKYYGWRPDKPDHRDRYYLDSSIGSLLPESVDLRAHCPAPYDQGRLGSCTAQAIASAIEFDLLRQAGLTFTPSRLMIYYNERTIEDSVDWDAGAEIRDGIKSVNELGICPERFWPYVIEKFTEKPPVEAYANAQFHKTIDYQRLPQSVEILRGCLADSNPFIFGFSVYEKFASDAVASNGIVDLPMPDESPVGGHAVLAVGYDDLLQRFIVRNSWGRKWGMAGYFTMPYSYLTNPDLASDIWTIRLTQ